MTLNYDAIVVGGGLGGLTAAAILAKEGKRVRLFEKHFQAGGYATTFFRDRFEFEVALHELSGVGTASNPGQLWYLFDALGLHEKLDFIQTTSLYHTFAPGLELDVPPGFEAARDAFVSIFPHEKKGIDNILGRIIAIGRDVEQVKAAGEQPSPGQALVRFPNLAHAAGVPLGNVLYDEIKDPKARLALGQLWGYFGLPPQRLSFLLFGVALYSYIRFGGCLIRQKSQALANALVTTIQESGSQVSLAHGVRKIVVEDGAVRGVITEQGEAYTADTVVSNVSAPVTCYELINPDLIDENYKERLRFGRPSLSSFCVYLGLSRSSRELGIQHHDVYINQQLDMESQYKACFQIAAPQIMGLCAYDVENEAFCPPGSGVLTLIALADGNAWQKAQSHKYTDLKIDIARQMLRQAEAYYPELSKHIETAVISTPLTNVRYTGNPQGAIYGFDSTPEHNPGFRLDNKGPFKGLWFAGAWTQPSAGYQGVISSGHRVADAILKDYGENRIVPREKDLAARMIDQAPADVLKGKVGKGTGYKSLLRDIKEVGKTVRTKYKVPKNEQPLIQHISAKRIVRRYYAERQSMTIKEKIEQTPDTVTLRLVPETGTVPPFYAGQYFNLFIETEGKLIGRPYSASSAPGGLSSIEFTVKRKETGFISPHLVDHAMFGDRVFLTGPAGEFYFNPLRDTEKVVGIAVGSGITPFLSMIEDFAQKGKNVSMALIYGSRSEEDIIFHERLINLAQQHDWLRVFPTLTQPSTNWKGLTGRIDAQMVEQCLGKTDLQGSTFFVCGPRELYRSLLTGLGELGVARRRIRLESFGPPEDPTQEERWPSHVEKCTNFTIRIEGQDIELTAAAGEPLLNAFDRAGLHRSHLCRADVCDSCRMKLVDGEVFVPPDPQNQRIGHEGYIHLCMAYPISDVTLND